MKLPPLSPEWRLAWMWREHYPGQSTPTWAEYGLLTGMSEEDARRWVLRCSAWVRAELRRERLHEKVMAGLLPHEVGEIRDRLEANDAS